MRSEKEIFSKIIEKYEERVKELNCLYEVEEVLKKNPVEPGIIFRKIIEIIPKGWQYPSICVVRIVFDDKVYCSEGFVETEWMQKADITVGENISGEIQIYYTQLIRMIKNSPFLPDEQRLLNTIANQTGSYLFNRDVCATLEFLRSNDSVSEQPQFVKQILSAIADEHWKWRQKMAQNIADSIDLHKYCIKGIYIIGSTKNAVAGPASDIDLLVHFSGDQMQRRELIAYIEGWGYCLTELNFLRTGHKTEGSLIDLHLITDEDIRQQTSYAVMLTSPHNSARPLRIDAS